MNASQVFLWCWLCRAGKLVTDSKVPSQGKTQTDRLWIYVRDDQPKG